MYLHDTLYERAPHYWIFIGVLLIILGIYLGVEMSNSFLIVGVTLGLASCAWGIRVMMRRSRRSDDAGATASSISTD